MNSITSDEARLGYVKQEFNSIVAYLIERMATEKVNLHLELQQVTEERDALLEQVKAFQAADQEKDDPDPDPEDPLVEP